MASKNDIGSRAKLLFKNSRFEIYKPKSKMTVSEWADLKLYLPPEVSAEPGKWRTDRAEYQRGMMDAVCDPEVIDVVLMTSAQIGKSSVEDCIICYFIEQDPCPLMIVYPTDSDIEDYSKSRLSPIINETPSLKILFGDMEKEKVKGDTIKMKMYPGGRLYMTGANSPSRLSRVSMRGVIFDEIDKYGLTKEGDPIKLGKKRTQTFYNKFHIYSSTPTIEGISRIASLYENSDRRKYYVPCPECNEFQILKWPNVKWERNKDDEIIFDSVYYECEHCHGKIKESSKNWMINNGEWKAENVFRGIAGFWINELYSPWSTWYDMAVIFNKAKKNRESLQEFINLALGETWVEEGEELDEEDLMNHKEMYPDDCDVPQGGLILIAAVDVQRDRIEYEVKAYGIEMESWGIEYDFILGNPNDDLIWQQLDNRLERDFKHQSGVLMNVLLVTIDSGDGYSTDKVYDVCKKNEFKRWFPVKGLSYSVGKPIIPVKPSIAGRQKVKLWLVGTDTAKIKIHNALKDIKENRKMHFPMKYPDYYFNQLTAEKAIFKIDNSGFPHRIWKKVKTRNEALDINVYCLAAISILRPNFESLAQHGPINAPQKNENGEIIVRKMRRTNGIEL